MRSAPAAALAAALLLTACSGTDDDPDAAPSAAPSAPTIGRLPVFTMLPSAFSSMVESPPAMLPWVGCEPSRLAPVLSIMSM